MIIPDTEQEDISKAWSEKCVLVTTAAQQL